MKRSRANQYVSYLLDQARVVCRQEGYSADTEERYLYWIRRFLNEHEVFSPSDLQLEGARTFLGSLREYAYSTQKQARNALQFLFDDVLVGPVGGDARSAEAIRTSMLRGGASVRREVLPSRAHRPALRGGRTSALPSDGRTAAAIRRASA